MGQTVCRRAYERKNRLSSDDNHSWSSDYQGYGQHTSKQTRNSCDSSNSSGSSNQPPSNLSSTTDGPLSSMDGPLPPMYRPFSAVDEPLPPKHEPLPPMYTPSSGEVHGASSLGLSTKRHSLSSRIEAKKATACPAISVPSPLPTSDSSKVFGSNNTLAAATAQLFEPTLQLRFSQIEEMITAYRASCIQFPFAEASINRPFDTKAPTIGSFATSPRVIDNEVLIHTTCQIRARSAANIHQILTASDPESWLRPCRHVSSDKHHRLPLRDSRLTFGEFQAYAMGHGDWEIAANTLSAGPPSGPIHIETCGCCNTDYSIRTWRRKSWGKGGAEVKEWFLDIEVWHNLGSGRGDIVDSKWFRFVSDTPLVACERGLGSCSVEGSVAEAWGEY